MKIIKQGLPKEMLKEKIGNRKEYVAITRARYYLYVLNTKCKAAIGD